MVGLLLFVLVPLLGLLITGALGTAVATVMLTALEAAEVLLAASVALAVIEWAPSERAAVGVKLQVTELLASAVPLMVGLLLFVLVPLLGLLITGALGAAVSTVMLTALEATEVL